MNAIEFLQNNLTAIVQQKTNKQQEHAACAARIEQLNIDLSALDIAITNMQNAINAIGAGE